MIRQEEPQVAYLLHAFYQVGHVCLLLLNGHIEHVHIRLKFHHGVFLVDCCAGLMKRLVPYKTRSYRTYLKDCKAMFYIAESRVNVILDVA
jgi:hypothetical protein